MKGDKYKTEILKQNTKSNGDNQQIKKKFLESTNKVDKPLEN